MAFIKEGTAFPPVEWLTWYHKYTEYAAWYSGDPMELLKFYSTQVLYPGVEKSRFWHRTEIEDRANIVHLPVANDVASISAALLFSEEPIFRYKEDSAGGKRVKEFLKENQFSSKLLEGAEIAAALSGVFLKLNIDSDLLDVPIVSIVTPMQAFPKFRYGILCEVLFFRVVRENDGGTVWRLFENRSRVDNKLHIEYSLYKGQSDKVGRVVDFRSIDATRDLDLEPKEYEMDGLGCVYIPNKKPNTLAPGSALGINDYNGCISLMDSLDFAWTSWMRDIELGMGQLLIDEELLDHGPITKASGTVVDNPQFSKFKKAFMKLNLSSWKMAGDNVKPIDIVQFELRVEEHMKTCSSLLANIVSQCGYSPQTFGLGENQGQAESGTALRIKERKSLLTREKKSRYWDYALTKFFEQVQQFDVSSELSSTYEPEEIEIELQDSIISDPKEIGEVVNLLKQAQSASTFIRVQMVHPDWDDKQIEEEVDLIMDENATDTLPFMNEYDKTTDMDDEDTDKETKDKTGAEGAKEDTKLDVNE